MRSLRARLAVGVALVAVVPLAIALGLFAQRVQRDVREEASARLDGTLALVERQLASDGAGIAARLRLLGGDPALRRLYLVAPGSPRDLAEDLDRRRALLGLDVLAVTDAVGSPVADAASALGAPGARRLAPLQPVSQPPAAERLAGGGLAMAAAAPIAYQGETAGFVRGGVALDAAYLEALRRTSGVELILSERAGPVVARTLPDSAAPAPAVGSGGRATRATVAGRAWLVETRALAGLAGVPLAITGLVSTAGPDRAIAALRATSLALGLASIALAVLLALVWSRQVSRPVERLAAFSERIARGEWEEPLALESVRELETLVAALERMRSDLRAYRVRLRAGERQAAWSLMARQVAHEIQNPLTPIAVSVADLRRSFARDREDFPRILEQATRTIADEVHALQGLLRSFAELGAMPAPAPAPFQVSELLADVGALYRAESLAGRLAVEAPAADVTLVADRAQLRQALVNLVKNGLEATAPAGRVAVSAVAHHGRIELVVSDDGPGLTPEQRARLFQPEFTTKAGGSGLGLTIVERIVTDHGGTVAVDSAPGQGAVFRVRLPLAPEEHA